MCLDPSVDEGDGQAHGREAEERKDDCFFEWRHLELLGLKGRMTLQRSLVSLRVDRGRHVEERKVHERARSARSGSRC